MMEIFYVDGDSGPGNCVRLQKSFPNFLHSSHALRCVAAYLHLCYQNQTKMICIAVCYAECLILWDDLHFETDSYNIIRDRLRKAYGNLALYQREGRNDQKYHHKDLRSETV